MTTGNDVETLDQLKHPLAITLHLENVKSTSLHLFMIPITIISADIY